MNKVNLAAIDIGTNAVRLLIKSIDKDALPQKKLEKVNLFRVPLRLGFDVFSTGYISVNKVDKLCRLMKVYKNLMKIYDVTQFRACATSAMRDAENGQKIIEKIEKSTNIHIDIIPGKEEAKMIYKNHLEYLDDRIGNYMYVDVGGGSTEINVLTDGKLVSSASYDIGTIRMLSGVVDPAVLTRLKNDLKFIKLWLPNIDIIGSGGNITKLFRLSDCKDDSKHCLNVNSLRTIYETLKPLSIEERILQLGLKPDRADVIVPAAEIFLSIANLIGTSKIYVPVIGLADGIINDLVENLKEEGTVNTDKVEK